MTYTREDGPKDGSPTTLRIIALERYLLSLDFLVIPYDSVLGTIVPGLHSLPRPLSLGRSPSYGVSFPYL